MFDDRAIAELKKVVGWRDYFDPTEIPNLPANLTESESGQKFQDFHPSLKLNYIQALIQENETLDDYLDRVETSAIVTMLNDLQSLKKLRHSGRDLVNNKLIHDQVLKNKPILNEGRFVGVEFCLNSGQMGVRACINRLGLYLTAAETNLTLYLFNSLQEDAVQTFSFNSTKSNSFTWLNEVINIDYSDGSDNEGGIWYLGYYQKDLSGQAISYDVLDWRNGYCNKCDNGLRSSLYNSIAKYVTMSPFYVPSSQLPADGKLFDPQNIIYTYTNNWGFNFNISIKCNLTQFWIDNRLSMVNAIGTSVALRILEDMRASNELSSMEQNIQMVIMRDLEGDSETKMRPFWAKRQSALKGTMLDQAGINKVCLPCAKKGPTYGAV